MVRREHVQDKENYERGIFCQNWKQFENPCSLANYSLAATVYIFRRHIFLIYYFLGWQQFLLMVGLRHEEKTIATVDDIIKGKQEGNPFS